MHQRKVEDVQRRATKLISRIKDKPYPDRLKELNIPSLQFRRMRGDMIDTFKYTTGIYNTTNPCLNLYAGPETRGHDLKLAKNHTRLQVRSKYFSERIVSTWNNLPESVVTAPSLNCFKNRLDAHWKDHPMLYNPDCYN